MRLTLGHRALVVSLVLAATGAGGVVPAEAQSPPPLVAGIEAGFLRIHYNLPPNEDGEQPLPQLEAITTAANITIEADGPDFVVSSTSGDLTAGGLCRGFAGNRRVECPIGNVTRHQIYVVTGGGNDVVSMRGLPASTFLAVHALGGDDHLLGEARRGTSGYFAAPRYQLDGNRGNDRLVGGPNNDYLHGGPGVDRVFGHAGNDTLYLNEVPPLRDGFVYCGAGVDTLLADRGIDVFGRYSGCENVRLG